MSEREALLDVLTWCKHRYRWTTRAADEIIFSGAGIAALSRAGSGPSEAGVAHLDMVGANCSLSVKQPPPNPNLRFAW